MPDLRLPYRLARRVLAGELTPDQAATLDRGPGRHEPVVTVPRGVVPGPRQRENRGADGLNQTERRYRDQVLEPARHAGEIASYEMPCPVKVRIGPTWRCAFEPDALVIRVERLQGHRFNKFEFVDVKASRRVRRADGRVGHRPLAQDDAVAKIQAAARLYPWATWVVAYPIPQRDGGGWRREVIG